MNWQEIAGGIMQAFRNAGVKKDVIDLQEKQLALLTKQIVMLEGEKSDLLAKVSNLEKKAAELELELDCLRPKEDRLDETAEKILQLLANHEELPIRQIAGFLGISKIIAEHHKDVLQNARMIHFFGENDRGETVWALIENGRAYLVKHGLVK